MLRLELLGLLLLACTQILTEHYHESQSQYHHRRSKEIILTREVRVKEGRLRGKVVQPRTIHNLQLVDVFVGIPYAEPPVGSLRFSPPQSPRSWREVRQSLEFTPVCPQVLPNLQEEVKPVRYKYLERHLPNLRNQSEDCLYLNIYAPHQPENQRILRKYPVMVFIHGDKWNSGNPYDGTILAAYGNVVFVTINFRLGILGFLRPGIRDEAASNFGLLDQIAALLWLRENIAEFGGDPNSVTLVGHGTGAIFANLLLISPVANKKGLFKRAILMSGSAMSADAIGKAPLQITKQVAHALNCPTANDRELAGCLRNQDVDTLLRVKIHKPKYVPAYAPLIDRAVIPDKPFNLMENVQLFGRFDLMYGVTASEKFHILPPVALLHGMLDGQRDEILRDHAKATHELEPDLILSKVLEQYGDFSSGFTNDYATKNRDMVLEALSDSGTVAPLIMTANLHSRANPKSYMYVFSHPKAMQDYSGQQHLRTVYGEELPYVLGDPLDNDSRGRYSTRETLFSEAIMNWWCSFAYIGNPNVAKRYPYLTDGSMEWGQYDIDWPEYDPVNQTYFNLTIPPNIGVHYRSTDMQFWNEDLPNLLRHPNKEMSGPPRPRGPRPQILDFADGIGKYANGSSRKYETYGGRHTTPSSVTDSSTEKSPFSIVATTSSGATADEVATMEPSTLNSSLMIMVFTFVVVFILINVTVVSLYIYHKRQNMKEKEKSLKRRFSEKKDDSAKRSKVDKHENCGQIGYKSDSKPDLNDVIKNDKAYDNNSNFGRRSKLSRQNSSSTIDTHIKVREWIQQEIVHRCSPRFLRKTRETLQKEHQEKLSKQQQEEKQRMEQEALKERKDEPIYEESPALVVRPGKKSKLPKVSVAIDATPATRTESILNQVPIELTKSIEMANEYEQAFNQDQLMAPQVVVIEHHHSRSDPLPMETVLKTMKPNFSTPRIYESDSGSASSLYAKINPKLKSRLPRPGLGAGTEVPLSEQSKYENPFDEEIYMKTGTILTTFGTGDVNVTCREPTVERECISPEEALKTIKRRNYPKVLPDIEKRRSLPAPSSLFVPKQHAGLLKDYKNGNRVNLSSSQPPLPPPRIFGPSKSLEKSTFFAEENENQYEGEPITTNLHVGPLLRRQDSTRNNSDPSIIDSLEGNRAVQAGGSVDTIYANPRCPLHGDPFPPTSQSVDEYIGKPGGFLETGNPNWYKPSESPIAAMASATSEPQINRDERQLIVPEVGLPTMEPKIVITPRVINPCQTNQKPSLSTRPEDKLDHEAKTSAEPRRNEGSSEGLDSSGGSSVRETERREPRIIITAREPKNCAPVSSLKQPKIIIKPTATLPRNRDQRNIPKVSAIPTPEQQNCQNSERDRALELREKPLLREKPRVTRIPSFSRKREEPGIEKPSYVEKTEIVQRVEAAPSKITNTPSTSDAKSGIPTPTATTTTATTATATATATTMTTTTTTSTTTSTPTTTTTMMPKSEKSASTDSSSASNGNSSNSNTGTIKRKPTSKK